MFWRPVIYLADKYQKNKKALEDGWFDFRQNSPLIGLGLTYFRIIIKSIILGRINDNILLFPTLISVPPTEENVINAKLLFLYDALALLLVKV